MFCTARIINACYHLVGPLSARCELLNDLCSKAITACSATFLDLTDIIWYDRCLMMKAISATITQKYLQKKKGNI